MKEPQYLVKWEACDNDENTWEPPQGIKNGQEEVKRFHRNNLEIQGPGEVE